MRLCSKCGRTYPEGTDFCPRDGTRLAIPTPPRIPTPANPTASSDAPTSAGTIDMQNLFRRYRILRPLGKGGMGSVFLAEQVGVGNRPVALKVLQRNLLDDPKFVERFQGEAASAGRIRHSNVVTIYESGQEADGTPYIAMEYLEGDSLGQRLRVQGPLPVAETVEIVQQTARGLNAAHRLGTIHRDLKPDNIFLTRDDDGRLLVKVLDFGIAKLRESSVHTQTGGFLGTPAYMSFEQASGMRSDSLDARSDVYSLGVVAYEMLSGRLPFESDTTLGFVRQHLTEDPAPLRDRCPGLTLPPALEQVIMKALTKRREDRQASALEFGRDFALAAGVVPYAAPADSLWPSRIESAGAIGGSATPPGSGLGSRVGPSGASYDSAAAGSVSRRAEAAVATPPPAARPSSPTPVGAIPPGIQAPSSSGYGEQAALDARAIEIERALNLERLNSPPAGDSRYLRMRQRMDRLDHKLHSLDDTAGSRWFWKHPLVLIIGVVVVLAILFSGGKREHTSSGPISKSNTPSASAQSGDQGGSTPEYSNGSVAPSSPGSSDKEEIKKNAEQGLGEAEKALHDAFGNLPGHPASPIAPGIPPYGPNGLQVPPGSSIMLPTGARIMLQAFHPRPLRQPVRESMVVGQENVEGGLRLVSADIASDIVNRSPRGSSLLVEVLVEEDGSVSKGHHLAGPKLVAKDVIGEAKEHWHFLPPRAGGVPVRVKATVTVQFP